jgi:hypothetical protein
MVAAPLVAGGCAVGQPAGNPAAATSSTPVTDAASAAAAYASPSPPAAARMICSDDIREQIAGALSLDSVPAPQAAWADHVYRCTYPLPMGHLVLSVTVAPSDGAARSDLQAMRRRLTAAFDEDGLGQLGYGSADGTLIAVKDNMVLQVDATGLPAGLGATHERRIDFAQVIAAGVFNCWAGP